MAFENAKWIWVREDYKPDEYGEFLIPLTWNGEQTVCRLSCDGDYALYINGALAFSNQYGDYEHYKTYDTLDITPYLKKGDNALAVVVWHFGTSTMRHISAPAGLIFEIEQGGQVCVESNESTLSRLSLAYESGREKWLTPQLGYSYKYDATKEDDWKNGNGTGFAPSVLINKQRQFFPRPTKKLQLKEMKKGTLVKQDGQTKYIFDIGEETVGLFRIKVCSETAQTLLISYGEHLADGCVRRIIESRDFSFEYVTKVGENEYLNPMLRLGCRYLQIESESPIDIEYVGVVPQVYPFKVKPFQAESELDQKIYDLCLRTLQLCMMEHYVDCPWREQCLYAFDSRNQILCGYYAFEDGNVDYARANLSLMNKDRRDDGLLAITYPCGIDLTIPSFSLYYTLSVKEYIEYSGDISLAKEAYPKMIEYFNTFLNNRQNGLVCKFEGINHWNFYDWSQYSDGVLNGTEEVKPDAMVNLLTVFALQCLQKICGLSGLEYPYHGEIESLKSKIRENFFHKGKGVFAMNIGGAEYTELVNTLAVLTGVADGALAEEICEKLAKGELIPCALSMKTLKYDALIKVNKEKYRDWIWADIRADYQHMLDNGATATWETIDGEAAFDDAGSLCHGWTATPIYYYWILK